SSLPELTPTQMILELADRSTTRPTGIAKDDFVRVRKFHFLVDFVVVDYVVDPRVPLILGRPFLRTTRALIDVYGKELTLRVCDEAITFKGESSLPELTPTQMILELADRSTTRPTGIAEDDFVRVRKFHFLADFVVVDYVVDPRVPLILGRPFLRMTRALIDVYGKELTLRVCDEAITFKGGNTLKFSYNDVESTNQIDVIDVACEEYSQEVLEKELLAVVYAVEKFRPYLVLSKTIVYTDHSALKYLFMADNLPNIVWFSTHHASE
nr:reverse transcriptase domain-containing protein [Tanacetum cinerariifolium]